MLKDIERRVDAFIPERTRYDYWWFRAMQLDENVVRVAIVRERFYLDGDAAVFAAMFDVDVSQTSVDDLEYLGDAVLMTMNRMSYQDLFDKSKREPCLVVEGRDFRLMENAA